MKILLITDNHSLHRGGAEKCFFTLKELLKNQPGITVLSLGFGPETVQGDDFIVLEETQSKILRQCWRMCLHPVKYLQLRRLIKKMSPDIIHLHNIKKYTPTLLKAIRGYPTLQTVHDFSLLCPTQWNVHHDLQPCKTGFSLACLWQHRRDYNFFSYLALLFSFFRMRKSLKKSIKHFIAPSPFLTDYLKKNHFQPADFIFPFHSPYVPVTKNNLQPGHFLYLGQLEKQKGVLILLQEFHRAAQKDPTITLTIAGKGSEQHDLKEKIAQWNLTDKVRLLDWCENPTELYEKCCAVIFPSIGLESFGLVITEAMTHGRPVIGSNRGPTSWLVDHEKTGLLFDPLQTGDLAATILKLSANHSALAHTLGENALKKSQEFPENSEILRQIITKYLEVTATVHGDP